MRWRHLVEKKNLHLLEMAPTSKTTSRNGRFTKLENRKSCWANPVMNIELSCPSEKLMYNVLKIDQINNCIYIYIVRGLTFARNPRNSMWDCNLLCFRAYFSHTATMRNIDIICVSLHFCACLRRCQNHLLKRILKISSVICSGSSR